MNEKIAGKKFELQVNQILTENVDQDNTLMSGFKVNDSALDNSFAEINALDKIKSVEFISKKNS